MCIQCNLLEILRYMWQQGELSVVSGIANSLARCHELCAGCGRCELCAQAKPVKQAYFGTGRRLQQGPEDGPPGTIREGNPFAAETPMSAPGKDMAS